MTKTATENDQNYSTQLVAARFEKEDGSIDVPGYKDGNLLIILTQIDLIEKENIPENTIFYVNQTNLTLQKNK